MSGRVPDNCPKCGAVTDTESAVGVNENHTTYIYCLWCEYVLDGNYLDDEGTVTK